MGAKKLLKENCRHTRTLGFGGDLKRKAEMLKRGQDQCVVKEGNKMRERKQRQDR